MPKTRDRAKERARDAEFALNLARYEQEIARRNANTERLRLLRLAAQAKAEKSQ